MNDNEKVLTQTIQASMDHQCRERGFAAPVDVWMDMGVLTKEKYMGWRYGKIPYLEQDNVRTRRFQIQRLIGR